MTAGDSSGSRLRRWRQAAWLAVAILALLQFARRGIDFFSIALVAILVALGFAIQWVETQTRRPAKNYLRIAIGSVALGLVLVAMPLLLGSGFLTGLILWSGLSVAGLIWCIHYERTEPR